MQVGIYGPGGFGREVEWLISSLTELDVVSYIQDGASCTESVRGIPVLTLDRFAKTYPGAAITIAIGAPRIRERLASKCVGFEFPTLIHPAVEISKHVQIGAGSIICVGSIITVDIEIGRHVHINLDCTVGHDAKIGDFTTLAPGVHVSGNVHIGKRVYIGTGANIINGLPDKPLVIGDDAVIGAGACVTKDCEAGCLYAGVPAAMKKRY